MRTCPVPMLDGKPCGRSLLGPVFELSSSCLMHLPGGKDQAAFQREFERILDEAGAGLADFTKFVFPSANYERRRFQAYCVFSGATFKGEANFREAVFEQDVSFNNSTFEQEASFWSAVFSRDACFNARFLKAAGFSGAAFGRDADFSFSTFTEGAVFNEAAFGQVARFSRATFLGAVEFRETRFREDEGLHPSLVLSLAEFSRPEMVVFYKTHLGRALLHNCDVSELNFSSVEWRRRKKNGKWMVFEEEVALDDTAAAALRPGDGNSDGRDYGLIAELYQQLKKNYDERKDYWTAGDFHYGEMEMKRLHSGRSSRLTCWLYSNLGLVAWYKYASQYGESYIRPFVWLLAVLLVFTLLFPWAGLDRSENTSHSASPAPQQVPAPAATSELSYIRFHDFVHAYPGRKWVAPEAFFGNSLMTALSVAGFQKELKYEPSYPWGRALALLELLLTSALIALFLLAVRRQFKR
jgi:uncharacterized protein YjbI with pentapeptide repeats